MSTTDTDAAVGGQQQLMVKTGTFIAGGTNDINLDLGFLPDFFALFNYTKFATDGNAHVAFWFSGMTADHAIALLVGVASTSGALYTSGGFTELDTITTATTNPVGQTVQKGLLIGSNLKGSDSDVFYFLAIGNCSVQDYGDLVT